MPGGRQDPAGSWRALVRRESGGGWGQRKWGHLLHLAAYRMGLDIRPGPLLTDRMTVDKLLNLSEASASSSVKVPDEK